MVRLEKTEDGFAVLHGRDESEWIIVSWWPCSGATVRKMATSKMPKDFVDECARFADAEYAEQR